MLIVFVGKGGLSWLLPIKGVAWLLLGPLRFFSAMDSSRLAVLLLLFVLGLNWVSACFITNCPVGGKRSFRHLPSAHRQCSSCGPAGKGRCYGPWICCGQELGCRVMSGKDSAVCQLENNYPVPCDNPGESCGEGGSGRCALKGLCCSTDGCASDDSCVDGPSADAAQSLLLSSSPLLP